MNKFFGKKLFSKKKIFRIIRFFFGDAFKFLSAMAIYNASGLINGNKCTDFFKTFLKLFLKIYVRKYIENCLNQKKLEKNPHLAYILIYVGIHLPFSDGRSPIVEGNCESLLFEILNSSRFFILDSVSGMRLMLFDERSNSY